MSVASGRSATLEERIAAHEQELTRKERLVVQFFQAHPEQVIILSALEIAEELDISDATVIRAAQALGYSGLSAVRDELVATIFPDDPPELRLSSTLAEIADSPEAALRHSLALQMELTQQTARTIQGEAFRQAVELISYAHRICVLGIGPSAAVARYFVLRLNRFGYQALAMTHSGVSLSDQLLIMRPGDVLVAQGFGSLTTEVDVATRHAQNMGVPVVLLSDRLSEALKDRIEVALRLRRGGPGQLTTLGNNMAVVDGLLLAIATVNQEKVTESLKQLNELRGQLAGRPADIDEKP